MLLDVPVILPPRFFYKFSPPPRQDVVSTPVPPGPPELVWSLAKLAAAYFPWIKTEHGLELMIWTVQTRSCERGCHFGTGAGYVGERAFSRW